jgi:hypothetical protein
MASALRSIPTRVILEEIQRRVFCIDKDEKRVILVGEPHCVQADARHCQYRAVQGVSVGYDWCIGLIRH